MEGIAITATPSLHDRVCEEIRVVMARRKISQAEAARQAGWTPFYLSNRMTGKTPMNVNDLEALARVLGVEPTVFFSGGESFRNPRNAGKDVSVSVISQSENGHSLTIPSTSCTTSAYLTSQTVPDWYTLAA